MTQNTNNSDTLQSLKETQWTETLERVRQRELKAKAIRDELFIQYHAVMIETFARIGLKEATAYFDGSGDSGMVEEIRVPEDFATDLTTVQTPVSEHINNLDDLLKDFAYEILEDKVGGWEINAGAFGDVIFRSDGTVTIEYHGRVEETIYEEYEIFEDEPASELLERPNDLVGVNPSTI